MKFFAPLVMGTVAFLSSQVDANGVCYDPNHGSEMSASSMQADMQTIAGHGFDSVRTYISKFGNTEMGPIIAAAGLKAMLGVPYPQSDYQEQMAAAIKAAQAGGVYAIMVGNENLAGASSVPSDMISVIQQIKSQVPSGVLVGTVQRNTEVINYQSISGWSELVSACDLLGVNAHPFFNPNTVAENAIQVLNNQWQTMVATFGSKLILTETGWPSSGSLMGNFGSVEGAETFYNAYQQWSSSMADKFYFQMFDTPYRSEEFEKTFGLVTADSHDKFGISVQVSVSVNEQQQQQQQQQTSPTEVPFTEAPTNQQQAPSTEAPAQQTPSTEAPALQQQQPTPSTDAPTYQQQTPSTDAPTYQQQTPETQAPTLPPSTEAPTLPPTEAPTAAPTPEATPAPTEMPAVYQNPGSADYNTTSGSNEAQYGSASTSGSVSNSGDEAGIVGSSSNSTSTGDEAGVVSGSSTSTASSMSSQPSENEQQQQKEEDQTTTSKAGETEQHQSEQTQQQTSVQQQQDETQQANTQGGDSGASNTVVFGVAGAACAALVAFGVIYQARKRAARLEGAGGNRDGLAVTPLDNRCAL